MSPNRHPRRRPVQSANAEMPNDPALVAQYDDAMFRLWSIFLHLHLPPALPYAFKARPTIRVLYFGVDAKVTPAAPRPPRNTLRLTWRPERCSYARLKSATGEATPGAFDRFRLDEFGDAHLHGLPKFAACRFTFI